MFELFEKVKIKAEGIIGTIVDINGSDDNKMYIVESDKPGKIEGRDGGDFPLFDCEESEIEKIRQ